MSLDGSELDAFPQTVPESLPEPNAQGGDSFINRKIGGLPMWMWGLVVVGGAVLGLFILPRFFGNSGGAATGTDSANADTPIGLGDTTLPQNPISTGAQGPAGPQGATGPTGPAGPAGPASKPVTNPSMPKPTPAGRYITVTPWPSQDGSLSGIAQHYYGNAALWPKIYQANRAQIGANPNIIQTGMKLYLPSL